MNKKASQYLIYELEGKLRGLELFPNNEQAQGLVQQEFLELKGYGTMTKKGRIELNNLKSSELQEKVKSQKNESIDWVINEQKKIRENATELKIIHLKAKIAKLSNKFIGNPRSVINRIIRQTEDNVIVYSLDEDTELLRSIARDPSDFELFFISFLKKMP